MKTEHFNKLSEAELERLSLLMEECGEVIQIIGKIQRHGYESRHPDGGATNRLLLEKELGHIRAAETLLFKSMDLSDAGVNIYRDEKLETVWKYLHHQS